jgi:hypothetical protein
MVEVARIGVMQRMRPKPEAVRREGDDADDAADPIIGRPSREAGPMAAVVLDHKQAHQKASGWKRKKKAKPIPDGERHPHQHPE